MFSVEFLSPCQREGPALSSWYRCWFTVGGKENWMTLFVLCFSQVRHKDAFQSNRSNRREIPALRPQIAEAWRDIQYEVHYANLSAAAYTEGIILEGDCSSVHRDCADLGEWDSFTPSSSGVNTPPSFYLGVRCEDSQSVVTNYPGGKYNLGGTWIWGP